MHSTIQNKLKAAIEYLKRAGIEQPELATEILVAFTLNCPCLELYLRLNEELTSAQNEAIREGTRRLGKHEPIQYVLGRTDFMGHVFKCDRRALIPRPETEELVELIIGYEPLWQIDCPSIIDIGTGNGCIIVSLVLRKKKGKYWAVDISADAIALAEENARAHGVFHLIKFINADFTAGAMATNHVVRHGVALPPHNVRRYNKSHSPVTTPASGMDAVVANPPYVRADDFHKLDKNVRLWEPRAALDGGEDGLQVMRPLVGRAFQILKPGRFLFLEIGFDQWPAVRRLLEKNGFSKSFLRRDRAGRNRLVMAVK